MLLIDGDGFQGLLDGDVRALDKLGIEVGDDLEPLVAGPPHLRDAGLETSRPAMSSMSDQR